MKSDVSDYLEYAVAIYLDAAAQCPAGVSSERDLRTIRSRVKHEGLSFLTMTLPDFCKGVEAALEIGCIDPTWRSTFFRRFKFHGGGPVFLSGFLGQVFDLETGRLHHEQDLSCHSVPPVIIEGIRQICLAFKKLEIGCSAKANAQATEAFIKTELDFNQFSLRHSDREFFLSVSDLLWGSMANHISDSPVTLRHGPGATAEGFSSNGRFLFSNWHERLDNFFPFYESCYVLSARPPESDIKEFPLIAEDQEQPVKVVFVPKTLRSPRVIAIEPSCMQYAQQGIRGVLYDTIESHWLTRGHINFRDQTVNQSLAIASSIDGRLATIDLSDASDRVPLDLALEMFRTMPDIMGAVDACRSKSALLPDGRLLPSLSKFASMGSALCFPVESMYFYTICVAALLEFHNLPLTFRNVFTVSRDVYVYGDDIIVPADAADFVLESLRKYNCKPNASKTFYRGNFRESCGVDSFLGVQVQPVYIRKTVPRTIRHAAGLVSYSATANLFYKKGYLRTAELLHSHVESILRVYPEISENSPGVGRIYPLSSRKGRFRVNRDTQLREVRSYVVKPVYRTDILDGYAALTKSLSALAMQDAGVDLSLDDLSRGNFKFPRDKFHLRRSAMHGACTLKLRWVPAP